MGLFTGVPVGYDSTEKSLELEVGGGIDTELGTGQRIAAGIYYNYRDAVDDFLMAIPSGMSPLLSPYGWGWNNFTAG